MTAERAHGHLARLTALTLAVAIFVFASASSSADRLWQVAQPTRWALLGVLCVLALGLAWLSRPWSVPRALAPVALFAVLAPLSAVWSVYPLLTTKRAATFVLLAVVVAALAVAGSRRDTLELMLAAVVGGSVLVALAGIAVFISDPDLALQQPTADMPARWKGFGLSPNTVPTLLALTVPAAGWFIWSRSRPMRAFGIVAFVLLTLSIFASGSRGGTIASFIGLAAVVAVAAARLRTKLVIGIAVAAFYVAGIVVFNQRGVLDELTREAAPPLVLPGPEGEGPAGESGRSPKRLPRVVPHAGYDVYAAGVPRPNPLEPRGFLGAGDGRMVAWRDGIDQGLDRAPFGYGFGTEEIIFVDRSSEFNASRPENSLIGIFMQLGFVGVIAFVASIVACVVAFLRRRTTADAGAAAFGVLAAGTAMCFFQSYVYSVGSIATLTFWVGAALAVAASARSADGEDVAHAARVAPHVRPREQRPYAPHRAR